jgi:hypothetical protein
MSNDALILLDLNGEIKMERGRTAPTLFADDRRFSQLNNANKVFGTHRSKISRPIRRQCLERGVIAWSARVTGACSTKIHNAQT